MAETDDPRRFNWSFRVTLGQAIVAVSIVSTAALTWGTITGKIDSLGDRIGRVECSLAAAGIIIVQQTCSGHLPSFQAQRHTWPPDDRDGVP